VSRSYRVSLVLEFDDSAAAGEPRFVRVDPVGDPALAGTGPVSAVLVEDSAFRLFGHLSAALEVGLALEGVRVCPSCADTGSDPCLRCSLYGTHGGPCYHVDPDARCESPVPADPEDDAYCALPGSLVVELLESRIAVCSPCGERLWAEGSASEPLEGTGPAVYLPSVVPAEPVYDGDGHLL
jgi:hypothetical protein